MTHLLLVQGAVCAGTDVLADVVMVVGAVGAIVAVVEVVALLETLFSSMFVLSVLWGVHQNKCVPSAKSAKVIVISIAFSE